MDLINDYFLEAHPNPERKGCPAEGILKALAQGKLADSDPVRLHIASCSECYAEFRAYRVERERAIAVRKRTVGWSIAASLILACGLGEFTYLHQRHAQTPSELVAVSSTPRDAQVNLFNSGALRSADSEGTNELQEVTLPASVVRMHVTLPRFSDIGHYEVLVSKDKSGTQTVARGSGEASETRGTVSLSVTLDLRNAHAGSYFLATVRGTDNGTYYYPLRIQ